MSSRSHVLVECAYRGSAFHGVQPQPGLATVGGELASRVQRAVGLVPRALTFAARTDAGVNAEQNFATFWFRDASELPGKLRQLVELDDGRFRTRGIWLVPRSLNARNSNTGKRYCYRYQPEVPAAELENVTDAWAIAPSLNTTAMRSASLHLLGCHDFSSFRAGGCAAKSTRKTLRQLDIDEFEGKVLLRIAGDAFLRKMVRIIAGTLAEVGAGLRSSDDIPALLASRDRRRAGLTAPARGLCLEHVELPSEHPSWTRIWPER